MNFDIFNIADYPDESKVCCLISNEKLHIILKGSIQRQLSDEDRKYLEHCFSCFDMKSAKKLINESIKHINEDQVAEEFTKLFDYRSMSRNFNYINKLLYKKYREYVNNWSAY